MKKHIIIAGVPRSGKSRLCQKISKEFGYQHISMDSILAGIEKTFPETGINSDADTDLWENIQYISTRMALFIKAMIDSGEYDECDYGMAIDIFQLLPQHYVQYIDPSVCDIFYLGTSDVTPAERYRILRRYDTPKDYTYDRSAEENKRGCADIVMVSKRLKQLCGTYGLPYFDTSYNREWIFETILSDAGLSNQGVELNMRFQELAAKRYSVRAFKQAPIPKEVIERILMAGNAAPTAHNNQPQEIIVVHSQEGLAALKKCTECHYNAPLAFIVCYNKDKCWTRCYDHKNSGEIDASIVTTHMMLEATDLGIGSTWIMYFIPEAVRAEFALPDNVEPVAILIMGYTDAEPSKEHLKRRCLEEYVSYR